MCNLLEHMHTDCLTGVIIRQSSHFSDHEWGKISCLIFRQIQCVWSIITTLSLKENAAFSKLTRRTAMVPLQHHRTPPENSEGMLFLLSTCLKSDSFSSFINAVWWPATYTSRKWKLQLLLNIHTHPTKFQFWFLIISKVETIHSVLLQLFWIVYYMQQLAYIMAHYTSDLESSF